MRIDWRFEGGRGAGDAGRGRQRRWLTRAGEMLEVERDPDSWALRTRSVPVVDG
jgi:hypothetical protein